MPKIITARRLEGEAGKAREYVRTHILLPSGILGLIFMVSGMGFMGYQFLATDYYSVHTFTQTSVLLILGGTLGWMQTKYHRFLLREHPEHFAARMKAHARGKRGKPKREASTPELEHAGRKWLPFAYAGGIAFLVGASALSGLSGEVYYPAAYVLPWAGFFWAKLFFWRSILVPNKR